MKEGRQGTKKNQILVKSPSSTGVLSLFGKTDGEGRVRYLTRIFYLYPSGRVKEGGSTIYSRLDVVLHIRVCSDRSPQFITTEKVKGSRGGGKFNLLLNEKKRDKEKTYI